MRLKARNKYNKGKLFLSHLVSANFKSDIQNEQFKYIIGHGNNRELVALCMQKRTDWIEAPSYSTIFNFKWQQGSKGILYDLLSKNGQKQMVNHFENHKVISTKDGLFNCLRKY